jgi:signal transduction histidine kinase
MGQTKTFDGILMASISVTSLGQYVQSQLSSHFQGSVGLLDPSGLILYSSNATSIGENVFASQFQDSLPASLKQPFDTMLNQSLAGKTGFQDFSYKGANGGLAYQPVIVTINQANGSTIYQQFAILFVSAADILAAAQSSQVSLLGLVSTITILGIATTAGMVSFVVLKRNKRLDELVNEKTADLASALEKERKTRSRAELLQDILAHDIRNHNQVMKLSAELLGEEFAQDPYAKDLVSQLLRSVDGSTQLVENAQKIGKILSQEDTKLHPVDLMKVIEDSMSLVKEAALADGRTVSDKRRGRSSPNKDATVLADELLRSVFENIYANAVKYSDSDTVWIETSVEEETPYWKISISDKGKGIEDSRKEGLFTRYVESRKGSGLGLSIVHSLVVERYKGKIEIKNRVPGDYRQGTTFVVWLKIASPQTPQESTSVPKITHSTSS